MTTSVLYIAFGVIALIMIGNIIAIISWYKKVPQGQALVRTGSGGTQVVFDKGIFVIPILHMVEKLDLTIKTIEIEQVGREGLLCKDNELVDIKITFFIRVNKDTNDIATVAQNVGCERTFDINVLKSLFEGKFLEATKVAVRQFNSTELPDSYEKLKMEILHIIGTDLNGFVLDDAVIDYIEIK